MEEPVRKTDDTTRIGNFELKELTPLSLRGAVLSHVDFHFVITREAWFVLSNPCV